MAASRVPWWLSDSDLAPKGEPELQRDCRHETHIGLIVNGSMNPDLTLGILAIRCIRGSNRKFIPLGLAIADTLVDVDHEPQHSNPRRAQGDGDDGASERCD